MYKAAPSPPQPTLIVFSRARAFQYFMWNRAKYCTCKGAEGHPSPSVALIYIAIPHCWPFYKYLQAPTVQYFRISLSNETWLYCRTQKYGLVSPEPAKVRQKNTQKRPYNGRGTTLKVRKSTVMSIKFSWITTKSKILMDDLFVDVSSPLSICTVWVGKQSGQFVE